MATMFQSSETDSETLKEARKKGFSGEAKVKLQHLFENPITARYFPGANDLF